jgi:hypothetical protein
MGPAEYVSWITDYDNGLHVKKQIGHVVFDIQYQPAEYLRLRNSNSAVDKNSPLQYYLLKIGNSNAHSDIVTDNTIDLQQRQERLYYYSYRFQNDIALEENGKILPCVLYHFEHIKDHHNRRTFIIGFEKPESEADEVKLIINSNLLASLPVKIKLSKKITPKLQL